MVHVARMKPDAYAVLLDKRETKIIIRIPRGRLKYNIKINLKYIIEFL
jgi:hypothetical protein